MSKQICVSLDETTYGMLNEMLNGIMISNGSRMYSSKSVFLSNLIQDRYDQFIIDCARDILPSDASLDDFIHACCSLDTYSNFKYRSRRYFELVF